MCKVIQKTYEEQKDFDARYTPLQYHKKMVSRPHGFYVLVRIRDPIVFENTSTPHIQRSLLRLKLSYSFLSKLRYDDRAVPWYRNHIIVKIVQTFRFFRPFYSDHFRVYPSMKIQNPTYRRLPTYPIGTGTQHLRSYSTYDTTILIFPPAAWRIHNTKKMYVRRYNNNTRARVHYDLG